MPDIISILQALGIPYRERGKNVGREHVNICCPLCGEQRYHLGFHRTDGWWKCFVCGEGGPWGIQAFEILAKATGLSIEKIREVVSGLSSSPVTLEDGRPDARLELFLRKLSEYHQGSPPQSPSLVTFLRSRFVYPNAFGWDSTMREFQGRLYIAEPDLVAQRDREGWKTFTKPDTPRLFGRQFFDPDKPFFVLVEGIFDAFHFPKGQVFAYLTSLPSKSAIIWLSENIPPDKKVLWWPDQDIFWKLPPDKMSQTYSVLKSLFANVIVYSWDGYLGGAKDPNEIAIELQDQTIPYEFAKGLVGGQ